MPDDGFWNVFGLFNSVTLKTSFMNKPYKEVQDISLHSSKYWLTSPCVPI